MAFKVKKVKVTESETLIIETNRNHFFIYGRNRNCRRNYIFSFGRNRNHAETVIIVLAATETVISLY